MQFEIGEEFAFLLRKPFFGTPEELDAQPGGGRAQGVALRGAVGYRVPSSSGSATDALQDLRAKFSLAMLFISHDLAVVSKVADRVAVMYAGTLVEVAARKDIFHSPMHPYTRGLLRAVPTLRTDRKQPLSTMEGAVPPLHALPPGCPLEPRCELRISTCAQSLPPLAEIGEQHWTRCPVVSPLPS